VDMIDIITTPEACCQIARLLHAQQAHVEEMAERAERALDTLDGLDDDEIGPWDRALLAAAFEALGDGERARVAHMRDGLDALGPYADTADEDEDAEEGPRDAPHSRR